MQTVMLFVETRKSRILEVEAADKILVVRLRRNVRIKF